MRNLSIIYPQKITSNLNIIYASIIRFIIIISCIEISLFPSLNTLYAIIISIIGIKICKRFISTTYNLLYYPISTLTIIFYNLFFFIMPIPATLLEFKPVTYNLHSTLNTYTHLLLLLIVLIIIHLLYKHLSQKRNFIRSILFKTPFFSQFTSSEIWCLITFSSIFYIYLIFNHGLYNEDNTNTISTLPTSLYIINLLVSGYHSTLYIFLFRRFNIIKNNYKTRIKVIIMLTLILFITGIITNMRTAAVLTLANAFFMFIIYILYFTPPLKRLFKPKIIIPLLLLILFLTGPFLEISKAMIIVRGERSGASGIEMLHKTIEALNKTKKEENTRTLSNNSIIWDETYLSNSLLNRFCSIKILDETLYHAQRIGYNNSTMKKILWSKLIETMPQFIKSQIGFTPQKGTLTDNLYRLSINSSTDFGGARIGTLQGLGMAIFGYWYLVILIPIFIIIFYLLDSTVVYRKNHMIFSLWFFANILNICYYFSDRHYYQYEFRYITRTFIESIVFNIMTIILVKRIPFIKH